MTRAKQPSVLFWLEDDATSGQCRALSLPAYGANIVMPLLNARPQAGRWAPSSLPGIAQELEHLLAVAEHTWSDPSAPGHRRAKARSIRLRAEKVLALVNSAVESRRAVVWG